MEYVMRHCSLIMVQVQACLDIQTKLQDQVPRHYIVSTPKVNHIAQLAAAALMQNRITGD